MADLNALIAQGAQFRVPPPVDPMGNMPQLMQMQSMQQQNQLNQMTMQEKQRGQQEMNALRRLDPSSATYLQDVKQINPKMGFEFEKMQQDAKTAGTEGQIKNVKLLTDRLALLPEAYRRADTPEAYLTLHQSIHADPVVGPWLKSTGATLERGLATIQTAVDTGKFNELRADSMQSVAQILDSMKPQPDAALMKQLGYAQTPEGFRAFQEAKRAPTAPTKSIGSVSPGDFTPASVAKFNVSGNYGDLIPKPVDRAPRPEAAVRTQQVTLEDGSLGIVNMDTGVITRSTVGGAPVKGKDATKTGLSEQQAASNIGRLLTAANEIKDITGKDPSAMKPGATEALASSVGMSGTANLARSANRQIVQGAQRDALDALLYLATGAAYNKEQLLGQMEAYIPAFTDTAKTVAAKQTRMANLIQSAKTRAGKAWTPEMDAAMKALMSPSKVTPDAKAMPAPTGVDPALWGAMTPEEQKLWAK